MMSTEKNVTKKLWACARRHGPEPWAAGAFDFIGHMVEADSPSSAVALLCETLHRVLVDALAAGRDPLAGCSDDEGRTFADVFGSDSRRMPADITALVGQAPEAEQLADAGCAYVVGQIEVEVSGSPPRVRVQALLPTWCILTDEGDGVVLDPEDEEELERAIDEADEDMRLGRCVPLDEVISPRRSRRGPKDEPDRSVWRLLCFAGERPVSDDQLHAALPAFPLEVLAAARSRVADEVQEERRREDAEVRAILAVLDTLAPAQGDFMGAAIVTVKEARALGLDPNALEEGWACVSFDTREEQEAWLAAMEARL
jgi:hypothetical protein